MAYPREIKDYYKDAYEKAKQEGNTGLSLVEFVKKEREKILKVVGDLGYLETTEKNWVDIAKELRKKGNLPKYFPLSTLQKLVQFSCDEHVDIEKVFQFAENTIIQNSQILQTAIPRTSDLISSQADSRYSFIVEWISNAIDASAPSKQIGRFGEGFFQSLQHLESENAQIDISSKTSGSEAYLVTLRKKDNEILIAPQIGSQTNLGTQVQLQKAFSKTELQEIEQYIRNKFRTNTRAKVILNGKRINNFETYQYLNGASFIDSDIPEVHIQLTGAGISVTDTGIGMNPDTLSSKLLYPNTTTKKREKISDDDVKKLSPKETRFFYKEKTQTSQKTHILLQVSGVVIEDFHIESIGNIGECIFEFPSFSPLEDSRNEIKVGRETTISLVCALKKISKNCKDTKEKLALLEVISAIYHHLKERPSNIVDEEFTLESNMKKTFREIQADIESQGIIILPGEAQIVNTFGLRGDIFYIDPDFIDFEVENIPGILEISESILSPAMYDYTGKYRFFETPFSSSAEHDYLVYKGCVFINSLILIGKDDSQKDALIEGLNVSINLNNGYELTQEKVFYGRIPTSTEGRIMGKQTQKRKKVSLDTERKIPDLDTLTQEELSALIQKQGNFIIEFCKEFREKYSGKIEVFHTGIPRPIDKEVIENLDLELVKSQLSILLIDIAGIHISSDKQFSHLNSELLHILTEFLDTKNASLTQPTIEFIRDMYAEINPWNSPSSLELAIKYTRTLFKILEKEPKYVGEIMKRFKGKSLAYFQEMYFGSEHFYKFISEGWIDKSDNLEDIGRKIFYHTNQMNNIVENGFKKQVAGMKIFGDMLSAKLAGRDTDQDTQEAKKAQEQTSITQEWRIYEKGSWLNQNYFNVHINTHSELHNDTISDLWNRFQGFRSELWEEDFRKFVLTWRKKVMLHQKLEHILIKSGGKAMELYSKNLTELESNPIWGNHEDLALYFSTEKSFNFDVSWSFYEDILREYGYTVQGETIVSLNAQNLYEADSEYLLDIMLDVFPDPTTDTYDIQLLIKNLKHIPSEIVTIFRKKLLEENRDISELYGILGDTYFGLLYPFFLNEEEHGRRANRATNMLRNVFQYEEKQKKQEVNAQRTILEQGEFEDYKEYSITGTHTFQDFLNSLHDFSSPNSHKNEGMSLEDKIGGIASYMKTLHDVNQKNTLRHLIIPLRKKVILHNILGNILLQYHEEKQGFAGGKDKKKIQESTLNNLGDFQAEIFILFGYDDDKIASALGKLQRDIQKFWEHDIFGKGLLDKEDFSEIPYYPPEELFVFFYSEYTFSYKDDPYDYFERLDYDSILHELGISPLGSTNLRELPEGFFESLNGKYDEDIIAFAQFLESDGDFLIPEESKVDLCNPSTYTTLSQVIHTSMKHHGEISQGISLSELGRLILSGEKRGTHYNDIISGVCIAQDEVSMYFLREGIQNARDALINNELEKKTIEVNSYARDSHFAISISDAVGMSLSDVIIKLLTPYNSGKDGNNTTGKFGKGFFTFAVGCKELRIKTSTGDGIASYLRLTPIMQDGVIYDFEVEIEEREEKFKGTTIERVDELSGISGNLRALIGTNLLKKYVGNVEGVDILYNGNTLNKKENKTLLKEIEVREVVHSPEEEHTLIKVEDLNKVYGPAKGSIMRKILEDSIGRSLDGHGILLDSDNKPFAILSAENMRSGEENEGKAGNSLGQLRIYRSSDNIERFTKDNLWISEIKDELLSDLPDWMVQYCRDQRLSIDIPERIPLIGSRNSLENKQYYIRILKPYVYRMVIDLVLHDHITGALRIPMMPEDYLSYLEYEGRGNYKIGVLASKYNEDTSYTLSGDEVELLKDSGNMAHFLSLVDFEHLGKRVSLKKIKKQIHDNNLQTSGLGERFSAKVFDANERKDKQNSHAKKRNLSQRKVSEISGISVQQLKKFESFIYERFEQVIQDLYGGNFKISYHTNPKGGEIADSYGDTGYGLSFRVDIPEFTRLVNNLESAKNREAIINIVAHEMTHNEEDKLGLRKWGTHETDETHDASFMKINRGVLTRLIRSIA